LRERINILELRVGKERHRVVLDGVMRLFMNGAAGLPRICCGLVCVGGCVKL
jgi:hypothetical protein